MNCKEGRPESKWLPSDENNQEILKQNQSWFHSVGIKLLPLGGKEIFPCNALFYRSQQDEFEKSKPYIDRPDTVIKNIRDLLNDEEEDDSVESIISSSGIPDLIAALKARI